MKPLDSKPLESKPLDLQAADLKPVLRVLIVDDEELARRLITEYLKPHTDLLIVGECENGFQAVQSISELEPDLIFLDIQMPKLSGIEVLQLTGRHSGVIFSTAFEEFALQAFERHAIDYLLKPYSQQRFDMALEKARKLLNHRLAQQISAEPAKSTRQTQQTQQTQQTDQNEANFRNLVHEFIPETVKPQRILIRDRGLVHIIDVAKIEYVEAQDDYINIHTSGKSILKTQSLSEFEKQLDASQFVRIHRSFLLHLPALKTLERISKDSHVAQLHNGAQLPISRAGYERLKTLL